MHKIRNNNFVASPAVYRDNQIELLHADEFKKAGSRFTGILPEDISLRKSFDLETEFFYTIENFDSEEIRLTFDEWIKLDKVQDQLIISPPLEKSSYEIKPLTGVTKKVFLKFLVQQ